MKKLLFLFLILFSAMYCTKPRLKNGIDVLFSEKTGLLENKKIGVICNHTAKNKNGQHLVDLIMENKNFNLKVVFSPEHGFTGDITGGKEIKSSTDSIRKINIFSLYGKNKKPTNEMLRDIDILVYDIQDVGARFYTYISTMGLCMEAAAEKRIEFVVLDRLNPLGGEVIEGPVLNEEYKSFVGLYEIPIRYGLTVGELASMINGEGWLKNGIKANLKIIKLKNWKRSKHFIDYDLVWNSPSPNIPDFETAVIYPGLCLLEGTNISEGRGTHYPFKYIGAPWIDSKKLIEEIEKYRLVGVEFDTVKFIPKKIPGMAESPKYMNNTCYGIKLAITDFEKFESVKAGITILYTVKKLFPEHFRWLQSLYIDKLWGSKTLRRMLDNSSSPQEIIVEYKEELKDYNYLRKKYFLYK